MQVEKKNEMATKPLYNAARRSLYDEKSPNDMQEKNCPTLRVRKD